jgi:hypothetical protein
MVDRKLFLVNRKIFLPARGLGRAIPEEWKKRRTPSLLKKRLFLEALHTQKLLVVRRRNLNDHFLSAPRAYDLV